MQGEGNAAFNLSLILDTTGPTVVDSTLHEGDLYAPESWSFAFIFGEPLASSGLGIEDVLLHEALSNTDVSATNLSYDASTNTVTVDFPALTEGNYTLTLLAGPNAFRDEVGNSLNDGADEVVHFSVDASSTAFPVPLNAQSPAGSLIHTGSVTGAFYQGGDSDEYTVALDGNQTLSAVLRPIDPTFTGRIEVYDPDGVWLGTFQAGATGEPAALNAVAASTAGEYIVRVTSNDEAGRYRIELTLNAGLEQETLGWLDNSQWYLAETLDASVIDLGGARRAAVVGRAARGQHRRGARELHARCRRRRRRRLSGLAGPERQRKRLRADRDVGWQRPRLDRDGELWGRFQSDREPGDLDGRSFEPEPHECAPAVLDGGVRRILRRGRRWHRRQRRRQHLAPHLDRAH